MDVLTIIILVIILLSGLAIYYIITYNKLQHIRNRIEVAESNIDDALRSKYDLICELNTEIKNVITEKDYLKEYIDLKNNKLTNYETDRKLIEAINLIKELKYDHKKLNTKEFDKKVNKVIKIDETLVASKNFFNKYTEKLNELIRKFPTNIVARNHRFKIKPYFDNKNMQDAIYDDFKL